MCVALNPAPNVGRERRERVSQLVRCGGGALIRAAASTQPLGGII